MAQVFTVEGFRFSMLNQSPAVNALLGAVVASLPHISGPKSGELVKALTEFERFSADVVMVPRQMLSGLVEMAESHVGDIVSGIKEGYYEASDNPTIDDKQCTVDHATLLLDGRQNNGGCDHGG